LKQRESDQVPEQHRTEFVQQQWPELGEDQYEQWIQERYQQRQLLYDERMSADDYTK